MNDDGPLRWVLTMAGHRYRLTMDGIGEFARTDSADLVTHAEEYETTLRWVPS